MAANTHAGCRPWSDRAACPRGMSNDSLKFSATMIPVTLRDSAPFFRRSGTNRTGGTAANGGRIDSATWRNASSRPVPAPPHHAAANTTGMIASDRIGGRRARGGMRSRRNPPPSRCPAGPPAPATARRGRTWPRRRGRRTSFLDPCGPRTPCGRARRRQGAAAASFPPAASRPCRMLRSGSGGPRPPRGRSVMRGAGSFTGSPIAASLGRTRCAGMVAHTTRSLVRPTFPARPGAWPRFHACRAACHTDGSMN